MGETSRIKLFNDFRSDAKKNNMLSKFDKKYKDFSSWESINFANDASVKIIWNKSLKDILNPVSLSDFYKKFACDLSWAKTTQFCESQSSGGGGNTGGGGGNTSQGWEPDPTGNQTWEYQVRDCKWIARKKGQPQEYIISDNPKYKSSVDTLNQKLPNLIKDCNKTKPEETKSTTTGVEVPTATVPSQGSSTVTTVTQPGQTQGLGVPNVSELGLDEIDKLVNPVKPEIVTTPTTQKESVEINTDILKEEFYSTLKKIL